VKTHPHDSPAPTRGGSSSEDLAVSKIMPLVYDELRRLARYYLRGERAGQSLQATALVNEAYVRLAGEKVHAWRNRAHFCAIAASSMREILVERARARKAQKRGGSRVRVTLDDAIVGSGPDSSVDLLSLDETLTRLGEMDPQLSRIIELRFFGGLSIEESAETLGISPATLKRGWSMARAWLRREMQKEHPIES
jgi:RNA polymerase sigma-70 factor (ECF subfamily)